MPEISKAPQLLCASSALEEAGDAVLFDVMEWGRHITNAFAVRHGQQALAYLNQCAHVPTQMDWVPGKFWDHDKRFIICAVHGALYDPPSGLCVMGPCTGKRLVRIEVQERDGQVYWYPSDRVQPIF